MDHATSSGVEVSNAFQIGHKILHRYDFTRVTLIDRSCSLGTGIEGRIKPSLPLLAKFQVQFLFFKCPLLASRHYLQVNIESIEYHGQSIHKMNHVQFAMKDPTRESEYLPCFSS